MLKKANISWKENDTPENLDYGDVYFSKHNGLEESSHVFIQGNNLEQDWKDCEVFTIAELGFGTGLNFLNTIRHWINANKSSNKILNFISFEKYPLSKDVINKALGIWPELDSLRSELVESLPRNMQGLHRINFPKYKVFLNLYYGDANYYLPKINKKVDAWYLDGFAPSKNPELWSDDIFKKIASKSSLGATAATFSAARVVKDGLSNAGFEIRLEKGFGRKRDMLVASFKGDKPLLKRAKRTLPKRVAIIGAGLAGSFTAFSLAQRGIYTDVFEQGKEIASKASGAAAGVLMPYLSAVPDDRSEFYLNSHDLTWRQIKGFSEDIKNLSKCGVIRLAIGKSQEKVYQNFNSLELEESFAKALNAKELSDLLGIKVSQNGFYFPSSGWINPKALCAWLLRESKLTLNTKVAKIEKDLRLKSVNNETLGQYDKVILANAIEAKELYPDLEVNVHRGQIAFVKTNKVLQKLKHVFCHQGYIMPESNGMHLLGATYDRESLSMQEDPKQTQELLEKLKANVDGLENLEASGFRAGLRTTTKNRIPMVKQIATGVFVNIGHGSRGLVSASECGEKILDLVLG